jgi:F420-non-reducing hydrogenase iron-sulfur subunit
MFGARRAAENFEKTEKILRLVGIEKERIRLEWISAAESLKFAKVVTEMITQVKKLGPSPMKNNSGRTKRAPAEPSLAEGI